MFSAGVLEGEQESLFSGSNTAAGEEELTLKGTILVAIVTAVPFFAVGSVPTIAN
jgi:hypothetical protein